MTITKKQRVFLVCCSGEPNSIDEMTDQLDQHNFEISAKLECSDHPDGSLLKSAIDDADIVLVCIPSTDPDTDYITAPVDCGQTMNKRIVGVWGPAATSTAIPHILDDYHDAIVPCDSGHVIGALKGEINQKQKPDGTPFPKRQITRKTQK